MDVPGNFETRFAKALAQTSEIPDCFDGIMRRIKRRTAASRVVWGIAASLAISLTSMAYFSRAHQTIPFDVADELQSIQSHVAGDDILEEIVSCSLVEVDIE